MWPARVLLVFCVCVVTHNKLHASMLRIAKDYKFIAFNTTGNSSYVIFTSRFTPGSANKGIDMNITLLQGWDSSDIYSHAAAYTIFEKTATKLLWVSGKPHDLCKILKKPKLDPYLSMYLLGQFSRYTTLLSTCPVQSGFYPIVNFMLNMSLFPSFIPPNLYYVPVRITKLVNETHYLLLQMNFYVQFYNK